MVSATDLYGHILCFLHRIRKPLKYSGLKLTKEKIHHAGLILGLFFDSEEGDDKFPRNLAWLSETLYSKNRQNSS
jgi:hypothetical protein